MKTIAQQLNIKQFPFEIKDSNDNKIYYENSNGYWVKREYDSNGKEIYYENSTGYWVKSEFDSRGKEIYYEDSYGDIIDNRPKPTPEYTMEELVKIVGGEFKIKKQDKGAQVVFCIF